MMVAIELPASVITLGVLNGAAYALLAIGMVLLFRSSRVINFALAECGLFGAAVLALAVDRWHFPYLAALPVALAASALASVGVEVAVVRRLAAAPRAVGIVASIGAAQVLVLMSAVVTPSSAGGVRYPVPDFLPDVRVGVLRLAPGYVALLVVTPLLVGGLAALLRFTDLGIGIRAAASNRPSARLSGISASRMSAVSWALAGVLAGVLAVFILPTRGVSVAQQVGPSLMLRAITAAVVARMSHLVVAGVAAVALGVVEQALYFNVGQRGVADVLLLVVLLLALALQRDPAGRSRPSGAWAAVASPRPRVSATPALRGARRLATAAALVVVGVVLAGLSNADAASMVRLLSLAVVATGLVVTTGMSGHVSLGQFAIAAIAGAVSARTVAATGNVVVGMVAGIAVAIAVSVVLGLPALRLQGPFLAATTLGAAVVTAEYVLPELLGDGVRAGSPVIGGTALDSGRRYLPVAVIAVVLAVAVVAAVGRSGLGRQLRATRDNVDAARAMGVHTSRVLLTGFAVSGALAGLGGVVLAHSQAVVVAGIFPDVDNTGVLAAAVIGGLAYAIGPTIGALYVIGVPLFVPLDSAGLAATSLGWLLLLLYVPGGLPALVRPLTDALRRRFAHGDDPSGETAPAGGPRATEADDAASAPHDPVRPGAALVTTSVAKRYGGVRAVDDVAIQVRPGEVVALIGANGAGKTTLFELIAGAIRADGGRIEYDGSRIDRWSATRRARAGLVRSFQDAALFPALSARDCVLVALGPRRLRRRDRADLADVLLRANGLDGYAERSVQELSTGTRRILDFACCAAMEPRLLLLDEPAAGVAQREVEALAPVIRSLRREGACTVLVVEHDMALVRRLADRVIAMEAGRVIAEGTPDEVFADSAVVASYLGTDTVALGRSGLLDGAST
ncbi:MAG: ATP-binding cassette domain-containing protein [Acidimicrobiales bacterium]